MSIYMKTTEAASTATTGDRKNARWEANVAKARVWIKQRVRKSKRTIFAEMAKVTPALATALLECNTRNRLLKPKAVTKFANHMRAGTFETLSQCIAMSRTGVLTNGQHRLHAVVEADMTVPMMIGWGKRPEAVLIHNQGGMGSKTAADAFGMHDVPNRMEAAATALESYMWGTDHNRNRPDNAAVLATYQSNPALAEAVRRGSAVHSVLKIPTTPQALAYSFIQRETKHDAVQLHIFWNQLDSGAILSANSPVLRLREGLRNKVFGAEVASKHYKCQRIVASIILAWNALIEGRTPALRSLQWSPARGPFPEVL